MLVDPAAVYDSHAIQPRHIVGGEEGRADVPDQAADTVDGKDVQRVVDAEHELEFRAVVGEPGAQDAEGQGGPGRHEAGPRGDGHEAGHDAGAEAHGRPLPLQAVVEDAPGDAADAGGQIGDDGGHDGAQVRRQGRARVETEPADPHEDGADDDVGDVVRAVVELLGAVASPLAQHHRVSQRGRPGRDMYGRAPRKVETPHAVGPAARVPGPARDRIVDYSRPDEHEDDAGQHAAALGHGARGKGYRDGGEHALVDGEHEVGDSVGAHRGAGEDAPEAEIGEVTDEGAGGVGEGERVTPEEPLEGRDRRGHDG